MIRTYSQLKICYICKKNENINKYTSDRDYSKVKDHCHYAGTYRSAGHSICNLKYSIPKEIPVVRIQLSREKY